MKYGHRFSGSHLAEAFRAYQLRPLGIRYGGGTARDVTLNLSRIPVWNQGARGSCVTHAGLFCAAYVGAVPPNPSRQLVDYHCRLSHGEQCVDEGTWPHVLVSVVATLGVCSEDREPYLSEFAMRPSDWAEQGAYDHRVSVGHALDGEGDTLDLIEEALRCDVPVFGGWSIDRAFEQMAPGHVWPGCGSVSLGGHSMAIVGVRYRVAASLSDDPREWLLRNSWGADWCDDGHVWVSSRAIRQGGDYCLFGR